MQAPSFRVCRHLPALFSRPASAFSAARFSTSIPRAKAAPPELLAVQSLDADAEHALARQWLDDFALADIPKDAYEVSFVRSSGPGGQHVNKTNSKAVVHCNIHKAKWLPAFMVTELRKSRYYHTPNLLFTSQTTRSAPQNLQAALGIMHETIVKTGRGLIRGEMSAEKKLRMEHLASIEQGRRRNMKDKQKNKKESRRKDW